MVHTLRQRIWDGSGQSAEHILPVATVIEVMAIAAHERSVWRARFRENSRRLTFARSRSFCRSERRTGDDDLARSWRVSRDRAAICIVGQSLQAPVRQASLLVLMASKEL